MPTLALQHEDFEQRLTAPPVGNALQLAVADLLVIKGQLSVSSMATAVRDATAWGHSLAEVLIARGHVKRMQYYQALAEIYRVPFVDLVKNPSEADLIDPTDRLDYTTRNLMPWRRQGKTVMIATTSLSDEQRGWARDRFGDDYGFVITSPYDILWQTQTIFRERDSH